MVIDKYVYPHKNWCFYYVPIFPNCRQGHIEVFDLIRQKKLYSALVENLIPLMELDTQVGHKLWTT